MVKRFEFAVVDRSRADCHPALVSFWELTKKVIEEGKGGVSVEASALLKASSDETFRPDGPDLIVK